MASHPFYNFFQNVNRMGCHLIHIFIWKCESDDPHPVYNFFQNINRMGGHPINRMIPRPIYILKKIINRMGVIQFSIFLFQKTEGPFSHFHRNNFDILKIYEDTGREYWGAERIRLLLGWSNKDKKKLGLVARQLEIVLSQTIKIFAQIKYGESLFNPILTYDLRLPN